MSDERRERLRVAARNADWGQVVGNGGPPCFHLKGERFCLRAERWAGHGSDHEYVSLLALMDTPEEGQVGSGRGTGDGLERMPERARDRVNADPPVPTPEEPCVEGEGAAKHLCRMCAVGVTDCKHPVCVDCLKRVDDHFTQSVAPVEPEPVAWALYFPSGELSFVATEYERVRRYVEPPGHHYVVPLYAHPPRAEGIPVWIGPGRTGMEYAVDDGTFTPGPQSRRARLIIEQEESDV